MTEDDVFNLAQLMADRRLEDERLLGLALDMLRISDVIREMVSPQPETTPTELNPQEMGLLRT